MTHESIVAQLAFYYREPLCIELDGRKTHNPRLVEMVKFLKQKFVHEESAERFAERVKQNFHPTSTVPFPLASDLVRIENMANPPDIPVYVSQREAESIPEALALGAANVAKDSESLKKTDEEIKATTLREIYEMGVNYAIPFGSVVKTYGAGRVFEAFKKYYDEDNRSALVPRKGAERSAAIFG
jgi:hypothetical protein